jgi:hypothetical protein
MANLALFYDAPTMTADDSVKTHGGHAGRQKPPSHVYRYLASTAEPITWYRQLIGDRWQWTQTPDKEALKENPYSLNPYTASTLARRAKMGGDVPTGTVIEMQAPAINREEMAA